MLLWKLGKSSRTLQSSRRRRISEYPQWSGGCVRRSRLELGTLKEASLYTYSKNDAAFLEDLFQDFCFIRDGRVFLPVTSRRRCDCSRCWSVVRHDENEPHVVSHNRSDVVLSFVVHYPIRKPGLF